MNELNPILSICIPTFNRCKYLSQVLESITSQSVFSSSDEVEIVVSDNCSNDDTAQVVMQYVNRYPLKIKYNRNEINIYDKNFNKSLSLGCGQFLKLQNDTSIMKDGALREILVLLKKSMKDKPILFFSNGYIRKMKTRVISYPSFEEFFKSASVRMTWIGAFGIWREDYEKITNFNRASDLQLVQVDVLIRVFEWKNYGIIDNNDYLTLLTPEKKGGYDWINVFTDNYFKILELPLERKMLSQESILQERGKVLFDFLVYLIVDIADYPTRYGFDISGWDKRLQKHYSVNTLRRAKVLIIWYRIINLIKKNDDIYFGGKITFLIRRFRRFKLSDKSGQPWAFPP